MLGRSLEVALVQLLGWGDRCDGCDWRECFIVFSCIVRMLGG